MRTLFLFISLILISKISNAGSGTRIGGANPPPTTSESAAIIADAEVEAEYAVGQNIAAVEAPMTDVEKRKIQYSRYLGQVLNHRHLDIAAKINELQRIKSAEMRKLSGPEGEASIYDKKEQIEEMIASLKAEQKSVQWLIRNQGVMGGTIKAPSDSSGGGQNPSLVLGNNFGESVNSLKVPRIGTQIRF